LKDLLAAKQGQKPGKKKKTLRGLELGKKRMDSQGRRGHLLQRTKTNVGHIDKK